MKRLAILCTLLALLTACGAPESDSVPAESVAEAETETEQPVPELEIQPAPPDVDPETGDRVLTSVNATVDGGRVLRLDAVGQALTEPGASVRYGVRAIRVYEGEDLLQTLSVSELPPEASPGATTQAPTVEDALTVQVMNFDGSDDIDLCGTAERNAPPHFYYLWSGDMGAYLYAFTLRGAVTNPETREVTATYRQDSDVECTDYFQYEDGWTLKLVRREARDWKRGSEDFPLTDYYEFPDGQAVLIREEFTNYNDEGLTVREVREMVNGELTPVRIEILEGADGEYVVVRTEEIPLETFPEDDAEAEDMENASPDAEADAMPPEFVPGDESEYEADVTPPENDEP